MSIIESITTYSQLPEHSDRLISYRSNQDYLELIGHELRYNSKTIATVYRGEFIFNQLFYTMSKADREYIKNKASDLYRVSTNTFRLPFVTLPNGKVLFADQARKWFKSQYKQLCEGLKIELTFRWCQQNKVDPASQIVCNQSKKETGLDNEPLRSYGTKLSKVALLNMYFSIPGYGLESFRSYYLPSKGVL